VAKEKEIVSDLVFRGLLSLYLQICLEADRKVKERVVECDPDMIQARFKPGSP